MQWHDKRWRPWHCLESIKDFPFVTNPLLKLYLRLDRIVQWPFWASLTMDCPWIKIYFCFVDCEWIKKTCPCPYILDDSTFIFCFIFLVILQSHNLIFRGRLPSHSWHCIKSFPGAGHQQRIIRSLFTSCLNKSQRCSIWRTTGKTASLSRKEITCSLHGGRAWLPCLSKINSIHLT